MRDLGSFVLTIVISMLLYFIITTLVKTNWERCVEQNGMQFCTQALKPQVN